MPRWSHAIIAALALVASPALAGNQPSEVMVEGHGGVPLSVHEWGNPDGPPILLLHGFSFASVDFKNQIGAIADKARIIAFDLRGHGLSGKPWDEEAYAGSQLWAEDVSAVLKAKGVERPVIVGWSFGGYVALDYLRHCGSDCASGLVLVSSLAGLVDRPPDPDPEDHGLPPQKGDVRSDNYHALFEGIDWTARVMTNAAPDDRAMMRKRMTLAMTPPYVRRAMMGKRLDNADMLGKLDLPVLLISGEADASIPTSKVNEVTEALSGARRIIYRDVGHSPFEEASTRFNEDLLEFALRAGAAHAAASRFAEAD